MNRLLTATLLVAAGPALAAGELHLYNWGNYTSPELIQKFEEAYDVDMTVTDYDSNDTALAKIEAGGHGFDLVVPSANYVSIFREKGLIVELDHSRLKNIGNIAPEWTDVSWDPGRKHSIRGCGAPPASPLTPPSMRATRTLPTSGSTRRPSCKARSTSCRR